MKKDFYTTTEAARELAVSADTVLKWVRAGKITSYRTPGGHARIPKNAISTLVSDQKPAAGSEAERSSVYRYCWDYYSQNGDILEECKNCLAYRSRAGRCYEMKDLPEQFGLPKIHCGNNCAECDYFKIMQGQSTNVLIASRSAGLVAALKEEEEGDSDLCLRFASGEYECAALVDKFRPDYVVVDCSMGLARTRELCRELMSDERIPVVRIILASRTIKPKDYCENEALGWILKPFSRLQLRNLIRELRAN